jgi:hypothetical protein
MDKKKKSLAVAILLKGKPSAEKPEDDSSPDLSPKAMMIKDFASAMKDGKWEEASAALQAHSKDSDSDNDEDSEDDSEDKE